MSTPEPPDTLAELVSVLEALTALLAAYNEQRWSLRLRDDLELLQRGEPHGLETLLADVAEDSEIPWANLLMARKHGRSLRSDETKEVKKRLGNLRAEVQRRTFIFHTEAHAETDI